MTDALIEKPAAEVEIDENALEAAFWEFDAQRKSTGEERLWFKRVMRAFARSTARQPRLVGLRSEPTPLSGEEKREAIEMMADAIAANSAGYPDEQEQAETALSALLERFEVRNRK